MKYCYKKIYNLYNGDYKYHSLYVIALSLVESIFGSTRGINIL